MARRCGGCRAWFCCGGYMRRLLGAWHLVQEFLRHGPRSQAAEDAADDLQELQDLRNEIVNLSGSLQSLRSTLGKYYRALELVAARFPIGRGSDDVRIPFVWADAFK